ncbi:MAG: ABC transporter substrate-binding protein [bacterium]|nr:ABC transporter substrate-binding protein [bacterium]
MNKKCKTLGVIACMLSSILAAERGWSASPFPISDFGFRISVPAISNLQSDPLKVGSSSKGELINLPNGTTCVKIADTQSAIRNPQSAIWYCTTSVTVVADTTTADTIAADTTMPDTSPQPVTSDTVPHSAFRIMSSTTADTTVTDTTLVSVTPDTSAPDTSPQSAIRNLKSIDDPTTTIRKLIATIRLKDHDRFLSFMDPEKQCRLSLGKYWKGASEKQRKEYLKYYTEVLAAFSISGAQRYFKDIEITYGQALVADEGATVPTTIIYKNQREIHIDYRLTRYNDGWKAYDILIDNASLVDDYQKQYDEFLKKRTFDDLIRVIKDLHKIHVQDKDKKDSDEK